MTGAKITLDDGVSPTLQRLAAAGGNMSQPMAEISEALLEHTMDRFKRQVTPLGAPWAPRVPHPDDDGHPLLYQRGHLFNALDRDSGRDFAMAGVIATGAPAIYAQVHQWGARIKAKIGRALRTPFGPRASTNIPARTFLGIEPRDPVVIEQILAAYFNRAMGDAS